MSRFRIVLPVDSVFTDRFCTRADHRFPCHAYVAGVVEMTRAGSCLNACDSIMVERLLDPFYGGRHRGDLKTMNQRPLSRFGPFKL